MTPVQEIQAAIDKLTALKSVGVMYPDKYECTVAEWRAACSLITTLHRTIDAQLMLLRESLDFYENSQAIGMPEIEMSEYYGATHALAVAINGVTP